jgi:hypothetical protein
VAGDRGNSFVVCPGVSHLSRDCVAKAVEGLTGADLPSLSQRHVELPNKPDRLVNEYRRRPLSVQL